MSKIYVIPLSAILAFGAVCIAAPPQPSSSAEALIEARTYKYQFRTGRYDLAPKAVDVLERAASSDPKNVELLNELGIAYFLQVSAQGQPGGTAEAALAAARRARDTFERVLEIAPNDAEAIAGRGMASLILANTDRDVASIKKAYADLNRGAALAPAKISIRLQRAFSSLALPANARNNAVTEEDLRFLMDVAPGTPAADTLNVLLADMYLEGGRRQDAQREYERIAPKNTFGGQQAKARLDAMRSEKVPAAEINRLRANLGRECTMCH